jgi:hypothetical protein
MFNAFDISSELLKIKAKSTKPEDFVIYEVKKILNEALFKEKNILDHLKTYNKSFEYLDEENLDKEFIFSQETLKQFCTNYRFKFLNSQEYKFEIPYEAILKIKHLNEVQKKHLDGIKILGLSDAFRKKVPQANFAMFVPTVLGNYYLVHAWGNKLPWYHKLVSFPLRSFETLAMSLIVFVLLVTLSLPTFLITLDRTATYWCGYRIATYFHLLIFFSGVTVYILVGFNKRFSSSVWQQSSEFD